MPYLPNFFQDDEEESNTNITTPSSNINSSGFQVNQNAGPGRSGAWANLNQYLDANQDNAVSMANNIGGKIEQKGQDARQGIQSTQDQFNQQVDAGTKIDLNTAKDTADSVVNQAKTSSKDNQINDEHVANFKNIANASYEGPQDWSKSAGYNQTLTDLGKAVDYSNQTKSEAGRQTILSDVYKRPTYSSGQKNLDNLLISGNQDARERIESSGESNSDLRALLSSAEASNSALAKSRQNDISDASNYAKNAITNSRQSRTGEIENRLDEVESNWTNDFDELSQILSSFKSGNLELTQRQADALGVTDGERIYNLVKNTPVGNLIQQNLFDRNTSITADEQAQLSALDRLASQIGLSNTNRYLDESLAGTVGDSFEGGSFGTRQDTAQNNFTNYANAKNVKSVSDRIGEDQGIWSQATAQQLLKDAIAGSGPAISLQHLGTIPVMGNPEAATAQARSRYYSLLNSILNDEGYNNRIKIKG